MVFDPLKAIFGRHSVLDVVGYVLGEGLKGTVLTHAIAPSARGYEIGGLVIAAL